MAVIEQCGDEYERLGGRERGDRIVRCGMASGHAGRHREMVGGPPWDPKPVVNDDPMPVFVIKGKDRLAIDAIVAYGELCLTAGLYDQAYQVGEAVKEIRDWQDRNPDKVKTPDHEHVPVNPTGEQVFVPRRKAGQ
jgi:hypothetical protein